MEKISLIGLLLALSLTGFSYQTKTDNKMNLAVINNQLAGVHKSPNPKSEMVSQVIYGDLVIIIKTKLGWARIEIINQSDDKGGGWSKYRGWIKQSALNKIAPSQRKRYLANRAVLINREEGLYVNISRRQGNAFIHSKIVMQGTILPVLATNGKMMKFLLPSGAIGYINKKNILFLNKRNSSINSQHLLLKTAYKFLGKKYIWGGITPQGIDCSGLIYFAARSAGVLIPRDAAPQFKALQPIKRKDIKPGDLVYFSTYKRGASHVGIYLGNNKFIHSISKKVQISSLYDRQLSPKIIGFRTLTLRKKITKKQSLKKSTKGIYGQYFMSLSREDNVLKIVDILNRKFRSPIYIVPFWNKDKIFYRVFGGFYNSKKRSQRLTYKRKRTTTKLLKKGIYRKMMFSIQIAALRDPFIMIRKLKELSKKHDNIWLKYEKNKRGILWSSLLYGHFESFGKAELAYKTKTYRLKPKPYIRKFKVR